MTHETELLPTISVTGIPAKPMGRIASMAVSKGHSNSHAAALRFAVIEFANLLARLAARGIDPETLEPTTSDPCPYRKKN